MQTASALWDGLLLFSSLFWLLFVLSHSLHACLSLSIIIIHHSAWLVNSSTEWNVFSGWLVWKVVQRSLWRAAWSWMAVGRSTTSSTSQETSPPLPHLSVSVVVLRSFIYADHPLLTAPHQPRLDWQMWFAALGTYQHNPWFLNLVYRLFENQPEGGATAQRIIPRYYSSYPCFSVLELMGENPFPDSPPKYIRATLYHYHFTAPTWQDENQKSRRWVSQGERDSFLTFRERIVTVNRFS